MTMLKPWQQALKEEIERTHKGFRVTFRRRYKLVNPPAILGSFVCHWRANKYDSDIYTSSVKGTIVEVNYKAGNIHYDPIDEYPICDIVTRHYATRTPPAKARGMPMTAEL